MAEIARLSHVDLVSIRGRCWYCRLLAQGEKVVVLEYFELCGKFRKMGAERLSTWSKAVKDGETPDFGANLKY